MERQKKKDTDMTEGVIWKQLLWFALPLMVGNVFQQFYNTVDSIVVGNFVGKELCHRLFWRPGNWRQRCHRPELWGEK